MPSFEESGLVISLPEGSWFRFADTAIYKRHCSKSIKEMDFAYFNATNDCIELFELKDYTQQSILPGHLLDNLVAKGRDSLLMLYSAWSGRGDGRALYQELPITCRKELRLRLFFIVKLDRTKIAEFSTLRDKIKPRVQVYADFLGISARVEALDHLSAMRRNLPITEAQSASAP